LTRLEERAKKQPSRKEAKVIASSEASTLSILRSRATAEDGKPSAPRTQRSGVLLKRSAPNKVYPVSLRFLILKETHCDPDIYSQAGGGVAVQ
jgi:hypothetical protein